LRIFKFDFYFLKNSICQKSTLNSTKGENVLSETEEKIRIGSYGSGQIQITGISPEDQDTIMSSIRGGANWIRVLDGKLISVPCYKDLPDPIEDREMLPFWREVPESEIPKLQMEFTEFQNLNEHQSPSIIIQSLCGYNYSEENYKVQAKRLESFGFEIMRSRRKEDFSYWEAWFLPGLWRARGELKEMIDSVSKNEEKFKVAIKFLSNRSEFGTLDVCIQRLAQVMPD
jgi:hypothetical protein